MALDERTWLDAAARRRVDELLEAFESLQPTDVLSRVRDLCDSHDRLYDELCINLNAGTNVMDPKAQALLGSGLGSRPSLGYPGSKYEMGLQHSEAIETLCLDLVRRLFGCRFAELRLLSGAMANLCAFMALASPGDTVMTLPETAGGHATHRSYGAAGLYGLNVADVPFDPVQMTVDVDQLRVKARQLRPKIILVGASLALFPYPVQDVRAIADEVGARVMYDAAHLSGVIAGGEFQNPLAEGAHIVTMSTYKSLGGPPGGLILTNDSRIAEKIEQIAYPGLTANFDMGRVAALAVTIAGWLQFGPSYTRMMLENARALADALAARGFPVVGAARGFTGSHHLAFAAASFGGGTAASRLLEPSRILTCGIGVPGPATPGDQNGVRLATQEVSRWGFTPQDMPAIADIIARVLIEGLNAADLAETVKELRAPFRTLRYAL